MGHHEEIQCQANIVHVTEHLYDNAMNAVQMNGSTGEWFKTTVGVRQGRLLSTIFFKIFLERIMSDALKNTMERKSIGGGTITNQRFVDGIDVLAEEKQELETLVESFDKTFTMYEKVISAE